MGSLGSFWRVMVLRGWLPINGSWTTLRKDRLFFVGVNKCREPTLTQTIVRESDNTRFVNLAAYPVWFVLWAFLLFFFFAWITTSCLFLSVGIGVPLADNGIESAVCISKQLAFTQGHAKCSLCPFFSQGSSEIQIYDKVQWYWRNCLTAL